MNYVTDECFVPGALSGRAASPQKVFNNSCMSSKCFTPELTTVVRTQQIRRKNSQHLREVRKSDT